MMTMTMKTKKNDDEDNEEEKEEEQATDKNVLRGDSVDLSCFAAWFSCWGH